MLPTKVEQKKPALEINYRLKNMLDEGVNLWFGAEFNLSLRDPEFCRSGELLNTNKLEIKDEWFKLFVEYSLDKNADLWFYPVETVSESEAGLERTYQELCLLFHWKLSLGPGQVWSVGIALAVR